MSALLCVFSSFARAPALASRALPRPVGRREILHSARKSSRRSRSAATHDVKHLLAKLCRNNSVGRTADGPQAGYRRRHRAEQALRLQCPIECDGRDLRVFGGAGPPELRQGGDAGAGGALAGCPTGFECLQAGLKLKQRDAPPLHSYSMSLCFSFPLSLSLFLSLSYSPFLSGRLLVGFPGLSLSFSLSLTLSLCLWLISYSQRSWHELSIMKGAAHK